MQKPCPRPHPMRQSKHAQSFARCELRAHPYDSSLQDAIPVPSAQPRRSLQPSIGSTGGAEPTAAEMQAAAGKSEAHLLLSHGPQPALPCCVPHPVSLISTLQCDSENGAASGSGAGAAAAAGGTGGGRG